MTATPTLPTAKELSVMDTETIRAWVAEMKQALEAIEETLVEREHKALASRRAPEAS